MTNGGTRFAEDRPIVIRYKSATLKNAGVGAVLR
jgi:hypothetical protein